MDERASRKNEAFPRSSLPTLIQSIALRSWLLLSLIAVLVGLASAALSSLEEDEAQTPKASYGISAEAVSGSDGGSMSSLATSVAGSSTLERGPLSDDADHDGSCDGIADPLVVLFPIVLLIPLLENRSWLSLEEPPKLSFLCYLCLERPG